MVEVFAEVLNKMFLFWQKDSLLWHRKNNYTTNLMCLPVSASNSLQLLALSTKLYLLVPWEPVLYSVYNERFACKFDNYTFKVF